MQNNLDAIGIEVTINDFYLDEKSVVSLAAKINRQISIDKFTATPLPTLEKDDRERPRIQGASEDFKFFLSFEAVSFLFTGKALSSSNITPPYFATFEQILELVLNQKHTINNASTDYYYIINYKNEKEATQRINSLLNPLIVSETLINANIDIAYDEETNSFKNLHHEVGFEIIGQKNDPKQEKFEFNALLLKSNVHLHKSASHPISNKWSLNELRDYLEETKVFHEANHLVSKFKL